MPVDAVYLWLLTRVLFCCTRGLGCNAHPAFPAPSLFSRVVCFQHLGHVMPRERGLVSAVLLAAGPSRRRATARLLDEVVAREARQFKPGDDIGERGCLKIESESRRVRRRPERFRASSASVRAKTTRQNRKRERPFRFATNEKGSNRLRSGTSGLPLRPARYG